LIYVLTKLYILLILVIQHTVLTIIIDIYIVTANYSLVLLNTQTSVA